MDTTEVGLLLLSLTEEDFQFQVSGLPDKYMLPEIDAILEDLDSNALQSLETSAANLPTPRFWEGEGLTYPLQDLGRGRG